MIPALDTELESDFQPLPFLDPYSDQLKSGVVTPLTRVRSASFRFVVD